MTMISSSASTAIAIFVKTPGLSPLKTRLAATLGRHTAETIYRLCVSAVEQTVKSVDVAPYWAVAEQKGLSDPLWQGLASLYTGPGGLGQCQHHIYQTLLQRYQQVLLIGTDSPQLSVNRLREAIEALQSHPFVVGPALDGGYYLFAGRQSLKRECWNKVPYSRADTGEKLLSSLPAKAALLTPMTDLDRESDLPQLRRELVALQKQGEGLSRPQQQILNWLDNQQYPS